MLMFKHLEEFKALLQGAGTGLSRLLSWPKSLENAYFFIVSHSAMFQLAL